MLGRKGFSIAEACGYGKVFVYEGSIARKAAQKRFILGSKTGQMGMLPQYPPFKQREGGKKLDLLVPPLGEGGGGDLLFFHPATFLLRLCRANDKLEHAFSWVASSSRLKSGM